MASVLSLTANSPLGIGSFGNDAAGRSCSSTASIGSSGTVHHHRIRSISTSSLSSVGSCIRPSRVFGRRTDSSGSPQSASSLNLNLGLNFGKIRTQLDRHSNTAAISRRSSLASALSGTAQRRCPSSPLQHEELKLVNVVEGEGETARRSLQLIQSEDALPQIVPGCDVRLPSSPVEDDSQSGVETSSSPSKQPVLSRWLSTLRRRRQFQPQSVIKSAERWPLDDFDHIPCSPERPRNHGHNKSDSQGSSLRFVTAVKSATATLASASIATVSRRATKWHRGQQRSSLLSGSDPRHSVDSQRSVSDDAAKERGRKRRAKLEELIRTEESYVADLKALSNVSGSDDALTSNLLTKPTGILYHSRQSADFRELCATFCAENHC